MFNEFKERLSMAISKVFEDPVVLAAAGGEEFEVEVARSGSFPSGGKKVRVEPSLLKELASTFEPAVMQPLNKIGHPSPEKTETPAYGPITGLRYDEKRDRLMAKVRPTDDLRQAIREGRYPHRSIEFTRDWRETGKPRLTGLGWLGATAPAVDSLSPVQFAEMPADATFVIEFTEDSDEVVLFAVKAQEEKPVEVVEEEKKSDTPPVIPADVASGKEPEMANEEAALASSQERVRKLEERLKSSVKDRVEAFMSANVKRIPMALHKAGIKEKLIALLAADAVNEQTITFALDGKEQSVLPGDLFMGLLAELPEQVTKEETTETALNGKETETNSEKLPKVAMFAGADADGDELYLLAEAEIETERKKSGKVIEFTEAANRVLSSRSAK